MGGEAAVKRVTTLVFDIMDTVVDPDESMRVAVAAALASSGAADESRVASFVEDWSARLQRRFDGVIANETAWQPHQVLRRAALDEALAAAGVDGLSDEAVEQLVTVIHRAPAWPDSALALTRLRQSHTVVALSNADFAELLDLSRLGGLAWHGVISTEASRSFKPSPTVYRTAVEMLGVDASAMMMVAAHPWDLRAAAKAGLATAFVARPGAELPSADDSFDLEVADLDELAQRLGGIPSIAVAEPT